MAIDGMTELALMFKQREQKSWSGLQVGTIISVSPLEIRVNEHIVLSQDKLILTELFSQKTKNRGETVIIIPTSDEQKYFVIDKAVT